MAADSKTEKATPKKRRDERKKGNVMLSKDVVIVASVLGVFSVLRIWFPTLKANIAAFFVRYLSMTATTTEVSDTLTRSITYDFIYTYAVAIMPVLLASIVIAVVATMAQTRLLFAPEAIKPKFEKLNPISGIKKMFALKNFVELIKNLIKITVLVVILYNFIEKRLTPIVTTINMDIEASGAYILTSIMSLVYTIGVAFVAISALDVIYQWWDYERQLKMSKEEIKEEYKQQEGDPKVKGKIKEMQRQMAMSRMMQAVPDADVVIKNPTHFAVALKYDDSKMSAPIVVAKGQDELAFRIIKVAQESGVAVLENKPLARGLYDQSNIGQEVPFEFYGEIAEILVKILKLGQKG